MFHLRCLLEKLHISYATRQWVLKEFLVKSLKKILNAFIILNLGLPLWLICYCKLNQYQYLPRYNLDSDLNLKYILQNKFKSLTFIKI